FSVDLSQRRLQPRDDIKKQLIEAERFGGRDGEAAVEPAKFGFANGIRVVIDVHQPLAEATALIDELNQRLEARTGLGRQSEDRRAGVLRLQELCQRVGFVG